MLKNINCKKKEDGGAKSVRVKIIKAPLINTEQLKEIVFFRSRATILK